MALINLNNNYIRLELLDKNTVICKFYNNEQTRLIEKQSTASSKIIAKYNHLITKAYDSAQKKLKKQGLEYIFKKDTKHHYSKNDFDTAISILQDLTNIQLEFNFYKDDLNNKLGARHKYPIMKKYFSDVENSIPNNLIEIQLPVKHVKSLADAYTQLKNAHRFGETIDC